MMEWLTDPTLLYPLTALVGACCGSLVSALSYRLPRDLPVLAARSRCTACGTALTARDLVPILSFALAKARCRFCQAKLSWRYPALEVVMAGLFCLLLWLHGPTIHMVALAGLTVAVVCLIVIDAEHFLIPDELQIVMAALALLDLMVTDKGWEPHLLGAVLAGGLGMLLHYGYPLLRGREGLGMGDVKFFAVAGLWLGAAGLPLFFLLSGLLGIATALLWRVRRGGAYFPFGPALAVALLLCAAGPVDKWLP